MVNGVKGSPLVNTSYWQDILHDHTATLQFSAQSAAVYWQNLSSGFPSGQVGLYTTVANTQWTWLKVMPDQAFSNMAGRWDNYATSNVGDTWFGAIDPTTSTLHTSTYVGVPRPILLKNLSLGKFQATFSFAGTSGIPGNEISFAFNAAGPEDFSYIEIPHQNWADPVYGWQVSGGQNADQVTSTGTAPPSTVDTDIIWSRITFDGTTLTMKRLVNNSSTPTESDWSGATVNFSSTAFAGGGGRLGFVPTGTGSLDNLTIQSWNGTSWTTEAVDNFTVDSSGYASDTPTYDSNGNLTYDGIQSYTYDAWNRLIKISHAYRALTADGGDGNIHAGQPFETNTYDAAGRRIIKAIIGTGPQDCTYHYYLSGNNIIEEQNGSAQTINQNVWGLEYVDQLVQTSFNSSPTTQSTCDTPYWVMQDANYNVLGVCDGTGILRERYEYSAYGQRQAYYSTGSNDPGCYAPTSTSQLCEFGFQGLMHDQPAGLVYARARFLNTEFGRWNQTDPLSYADSMDSYSSFMDDPIIMLDPSGFESIPADAGAPFHAPNPKDGDLVSRYPDEKTSPAFFESDYFHSENWTYKNGFSMHVRVPNKCTIIVELAHKSMEDDYYPWRQDPSAPCKTRFGVLSCYGNKVNRPSGKPVPGLIDSWPSMDGPIGPGKYSQEEAITQVAAIGRAAGLGNSGESAAAIAARISGYDTRPEAWNAGNGVGKAGWNQLLADSWTAAKAQGLEMLYHRKGPGAGKGLLGCCERVKIVFLARGDDAIDAGGMYDPKTNPAGYAQRGLQLDVDSGAPGDRTETPFVAKMTK